MKPEWKDAPEWAEWLFYEKYSNTWVWCSKKPKWSWFHMKWEANGAWVYCHFSIRWAGNGRDSLEKRP